MNLKPTLRLLEWGQVQKVTIIDPPKNPGSWPGVDPASIRYDIVVPGARPRVIIGVRNKWVIGQGVDLVPAEVGAPVIVSRVPTSATTFRYDVYVLGESIPHGGCEQGGGGGPGGGVEPEIEPSEDEPDQDQPGPIGG